MRGVIAVGLVSLSLGCDGLIGEAHSDAFDSGGVAAPGGNPPGPTSPGPLPPNATDPTVPPVPNPTGPTVPAVDPCETAVPVPAAPLRRMSKLEFNNTVRDLFEDSTHPADAFIDDERGGGFDANVVAPFSDSDLETQMSVAEDIAVRAVADHLDDWLTCDQTDSACAVPFITSFGERAFRRPLSIEELADFTALYESARDQWGSDRAFELVFQALILSPPFLYHVSLGDTDIDTELGHPLTNDEMASALAFFLWSTAPDAVLLQAARDGELADAAGIEQHARRMVDDPRALSTIATFTEQWLGIEDAEYITRNSQLFPSWDQHVAESAKSETLTLMEQLYLQDALTYGSIMTTADTYANDALADIYGIAAPGTSELTPVSLDPAERAGVLTHPSFLAAHAYTDSNAIVHRGLFVRTRLLCQPMPPAPAGLDTAALIEVDRMSDPTCSGCHQIIDPVGEGFDQYDPTGRFDASVDVEGVIGGGTDLPETFSSVVELAHSLAQSQQAQSCFADHWFRFAMKRYEAPADACDRKTIMEAFEQSAGNVRELLVAITQTNAFRHRTPPEP